MNTIRAIQAYLSGPHNRQQSHPVHCDQCGRSTNGGKWVCTDHIEGMPRVRTILATEEAAASEVEAASEGKSKHIKLTSIVVLEILSLLAYCIDLPTTLGIRRAIFYLNGKPGICAVAYMERLRGAGLVTIHGAKRGHTVWKISTAGREHLDNADD